MAPEVIVSKTTTRQICAKFSVVADARHMKKKFVLKYLENAAARGKNIYLATSWRHVSG